MQEQPIDRAIIINTYLLQKFMNHGRDFANLLALYSFYIHHANLQKTNQPLATDDFVAKGLKWGIDRVKKTKKILKEMKVIEVVQKRQYYYIHLFFIYTKKKIAEILGEFESKGKEKIVPKEPVEEVEKPKVKSIFEQTLLKNRINEKRVESIRKSILSIKGVANYKFNHTALARWITYCERNSISYNRNNLKHWLEKLSGRTSIEQIEPIHKAIKEKWKNFYITPIEESKYHKFLGKSLMLERDCDTLIDIGKIEEKFVYQFKNIKITTAEAPADIFQRCGYDKRDSKDAPMVSNIRDKLVGLIGRFG